MRRAWALGLALTTALAVSASAADFVDPAPPPANALPAMEPPAAQDNPNTTFHAAPKSLSPDAKPGDWTAFLGPHHNLVCDETQLAQTLPPSGPPIVWETKRGSGYCAPAVLGQRLVMLHRVEDEEVVECLDADTGKQFWRFAYPTAYQDRYGYNDGPRCTPVIDRESASVFTLGAEGKLHCLELTTGRLRWKRNLAAEFKVPQQFFGCGCTPLVEAGRLIVNVGGSKGPCVAAFDVSTGKMIWGAGEQQWGPSYASPVPADFHRKRRVLVLAGGESDPPTGGLLCIDPADGKVDFEFPWRGTRRESVNASTPLVVGDDKIFISESYGSGGALLQVLPPKEDGKLSVRTVWTNPSFGTHFMTALAKDGCLYGVDGHGPNDAFLVCVDLATGEEKWRTQPEWTEEVPSRNGGNRQMTLGTYRAWLMPVDGRVLVQGEFGHLLWAELTPKGFTPIHRSWLFKAGETWTPPVVRHGLLYINQNTPAAAGGSARLICYDLRADRQTP